MGSSHSLPRVSCARQCATYRAAVQFSERSADGPTYASVPGAVALGSASQLAPRLVSSHALGIDRALPRPVLMREACDAGVFIHHVTHH